MTWTFDPLQSLNAHFNFGKLGVLSDTYKINFYGETTSSFLHQIGTDRLWVTWHLASSRVQARLKTKDQSKASNFDLDRVACLVQVGPNNVPQRSRSEEVAGQEVVSIEIPTDINAVQRDSPQLAVRGERQHGGPSGRPCRLDIKSKISMVHQGTVRRLVSICSAPAGEPKSTSKDPLALNY